MSEYPFRGELIYQSFPMAFLGRLEKLPLPRRLMTDEEGKQNSNPPWLTVTREGRGGKQQAGS